MIELQNLTKYYPTKKGRKYILRDLNFSFPKKTNIGVLGKNGTGKSTLIKMLAGIVRPSSGRVKIKGSLSWPLALSGGVQGSLTGRDNAEFVCRVHGEDKKDIKSKLDFIHEFSELNDYFFLPVKTYSSGMRARLLFSMSMAFNFDIYLIDEVTAVGDAQFNKKCKEELQRKRDVSNYIMVSHNANELIQTCDNLLIMHQGKVFLYKDVSKGLDYYNNILMS